MKHVVLEIAGHTLACAGMQNHHSLLLQTQLLTEFTVILLVNNVELGQLRIIGVKGLGQAILKTDS